MNRRELVVALEAARIDPRAYSVLEPPREESYCLVESGAGFAVYYLERGNHRAEREFATEDEACRNLLTWLLGETSTHLQES